MTQPRAAAANPYLTQSVRPRMFTRPWQRYAWAVIPLLSMSVLACLPFIVAWRRRVVGWRTAAAYTVPSAIITGFAIVQPDVNGWFAAAVWAFMVTAVVHVLLLDPFKTRGK